jgi:hypothetical protein
MQSQTAATRGTGHAKRHISASHQSCSVSIKTSRHSFSTPELFHEAFTFAETAHSSNSPTLLRSWPASKRSRRFDCFARNISHLRHAWRRAEAAETSLRQDWPFEPCANLLCTRRANVVRRHFSRVRAAPAAELSMLSQALAIALADTRTTRLQHS